MSVLALRGKISSPAWLSIAGANVRACVSEARRRQNSPSASTKAPIPSSNHRRRSAFGLRSSTASLHSLSRMDHGGGRDANVASARYGFDRLREKEIRVFGLLPGDYHSEVCLLMHTRHFQHSSWPDHDLTPASPAYETLSYAWGDAKDKKPVFIFENGRKYSLLVTRNCEEALKHLRLADHPRSLWVDAISINQEDLEERASQVRIMSHIYRKASQVNIWLGPASLSSGVAFDWIAKVNQHLHIDPTYNHVTASDDEGQSWLDKGLLIATDREKTGFGDIIRRAWFQRLWVWQEVRFNPNAQLLCGTATLPWSQLRTAVEYAFKWPSRLFVDELSEPLISIRDLLHQRFSLLHDLHRMSRCFCSDERDRIFSAQVFEDHWTDIAIIPDYEASVAEVFTRAMKRFVQVRRDLNFFAYIGTHIPNDQYRQPTKDLPSWVPDWSLRHLDPIAFRHRAASTSTASVVSTNQSKLVLRGVAVECITSSASIEWNDSRLNNLQEVRHAIREAIDSLLIDDSDDDEVDAFCRVLCCGLFAERHVPSDPHSPSLEQCRNFILSRSDGNAYGREETELRLVLDSFWPCRGRSLFRTASGRLGLGPRGLQPGDELVVFLGCLTPMVLRAHGIGNHTVVGSAYCDGLMDGEALLGPLVADYEMLYFHDSVGYISGYRNVRTGENQLQDPRLPPLPAAWKLLETEKQSTFPTYENSETGEQRRINYIDPRLDDESLQKKGIMLKEFTLV